MTVLLPCFVATTSLWRMCPEICLHSQKHRPLTAVDSASLGHQCPALCSCACRCMYVSQCCVSSLQLLDGASQQNRTARTMLPHQARVCRNPQLAEGAKELLKAGRRLIHIITLLSLLQYACTTAQQQQHTRQPNVAPSSPFPAACGIRSPAKGSTGHAVEVMQL